MTLIRSMDVGPHTFHSETAILGPVQLAAVVSILEIALAVYIYLCWAYRGLRSKSTTVTAETVRFFISFIAIFVVINAFWMAFVLEGDVLARLYWTTMAVIQLILEIIITPFIYFMAYLLNAPGSTEARIRRFIIIFVIVYAVVNALVISHWSEVIVFVSYDY